MLSSPSRPSGVQFPKAGARRRQGNSLGESSPTPMALCPVGISSLSRRTYASIHANPKKGRSSYLSYQVR